LEKGRIEVARRLIANGMSIEEAAEIGGVSVEVLRGGVYMWKFEKNQYYVPGISQALLCQSWNGRGCDNS
jgi:hypothetical protein